MNPRKYYSYTSEDFILDDDFRKAVLESCTSDKIKNLLENLPEKKDEINLAIEVLRGLHVEKFQQHAKRKQEMWKQIVQTQKDLFM